MERVSNETPSRYHHAVTLLHLTASIRLSTITPETQITQLSSRRRRQSPQLHLHRRQLLQAKRQLECEGLSRRQGYRPRLPRHRDGRGQGLRQVGDDHSGQGAQLPVRRAEAPAQRPSQASLPEGGGCPRKFIVKNNLKSTSPSWSYLRRLRFLNAACPHSMYIFTAPDFYICSRELLHNF